MANLMNVPRRVVAAPQGRPVREVVRWELFDTKQYPAAGIGTLQFFLNPAVTPLDSNMNGSGVLTNPQSFDAYGIAVEIFPQYEEAVADGISELWAIEKKKIREGAWLQLTVGIKPYLILPLKRIPEGMGFTGLSAGADDTTGAVDEMVLTHGMQDVKHVYPLAVRIRGENVPIEIPAQQAFKVEIFWPTFIPTTETGHTTNVVRVRVYLVGHLWREVQ